MQPLVVSSTSVSTYIYSVPVLSQWLLFMKVQLCCLRPFVSELISTLSKNGMSGGDGRKHKQENGENLRHRSTHASVNGEATNEEKDYTPEQLQAVKKYDQHFIFCTFEL